ncbi:hypothetical protein MML48_4g00000709 [Holotrichia oblita]|uniref:Uncharacterized protein n=1 Tax=Holotrichia oblita TaxID=644536 RepID=A0ACB9T941_HOLOL|nr:hypothetical protein MML48_4g00000709 [Holotrichia oblita]
MINLIRKEGNFTLLDENKIRPVQRAPEQYQNKRLGEEQTVQEFLPCPFCKGIYRSKSLRKHSKRCSYNTQADKKYNTASLGQNLLIFKASRRAFLDKLRLKKEDSSEMHLFAKMDPNEEARLLKIWEELEREDELDEQNRAHLVKLDDEESDVDGLEDEFDHQTDSEISADDSDATYDNDLKSFYKKWTIKDAMYSAAESWSEITPITLRKSWRKLFPEENDIINEDSVQVTTESLMNIAQNVNGFEGVDRDDLEAWLKIDEEDPGYEIKDDSAIVSETLGIASTDDDSDDEFVTEDSAIKKISFAEALSCSETLLEYLEQQDDTNYNEITSEKQVPVCSFSKRTMTKKCRGMKANWTQDMIEEALALLRRGKSQRYVENKCGIPRRTLRNHMEIGDVQRKLGRKPTMNKQQEDDLVKKIIKFSEVGFPLPPKALKRTVYKYVNKRNCRA